MPDPVTPHPEFRMSVDAMVAEGLLERLRADRALRGFMRSIEPYELEDLLTADTFSAPCLALILDSTDERRLGGNSQALLTTSIALGVVTAAAERSGTQRWLRARIGDHLKRIILRDAGVIEWHGRPVTEALVTFRRLSGAVQLGTGAHLLTRFVVELSSDIHEATREFTE